jgi:nucleoside-diphosphate-sugar epimerase
VIHPSFERILVTGGNGFIGRHVVTRLVSEGHRPLVTVSREDNGPTVLPYSVERTYLDLTEAAQVQALVASYRPTSVIHLAGATGHNDPTGEICNTLNFEATVNVVDALSGSDVQRIILIGSAAEYGDQTIPFREEMPARPLSPYAVSKVKANDYALERHSTTGLPVTVLRVFTAYGPRQPRKMFLSQLIEHAIGNRPFEMSDGFQKRDLVHISDVVDAVLATIKTEAAVGRVINIGSGRGVPLKQIAEVVWKACRTDQEFLQIGSRAKSGDEAFDTEADISLAERLLEWRPAVQIFENGAPGTALLDLISEMKQETGIKHSEASPAS